MTGRSWAGAAIAALTLGCASAPAGEIDYPWVPGDYRIETSISYRNDSPSSEVVERLTLESDVRVEITGPFAMESPPGTRCLLAEAMPDERDIPPNAQAFRCGEVVYLLWPERNRIRGGAYVDLHEVVLTRGACKSYTVQDDGSRICNQYFYTQDERLVEKRGQLRSRPLDSPSRRIP